MRPGLSFSSLTVALVLGERFLATSVPAKAVFSSASQIITKRRNRLCGETVRHIMCLHDWGPSEGSKWMVDDEELGDATGDALDDSLDGSSDVEMASAED
jgi:hypothetical protein